ncbi:MAG TPA: RNA polymerase sigma factor [Polyangiaceae bacterium]|nr:RNA polymerase sigma factor [Polyangiaceae bacterium]
MELGHAAKAAPFAGFVAPFWAGGRVAWLAGDWGAAPRPSRVRPVLPPEELEAERRLCERAREGDRTALGELLERHGPRLYRAVLLPRLGSTALAEEALSLTYLRVVERIGRFEWQSVGIYPWLRVVALRIALDQIRARKREVLFDTNDLEREVDQAERETRDAAALEAHDLGVARARVAALLGRVHPRYAQAIRLRVLEERPRAEAAAELGVTVGTFDVVLHRAMAALRKVLDAEDHEP